MKVKVGDRIATVPGGHVATVTLVDGPNWVVVRWDESGTSTGFKGIDSDYWTKLGAGKRRVVKRKRSYSGRRTKTTTARKKAVRKAMRRHPAIRRLKLRNYINRMGAKIRKRAQERYAARSAPQSYSNENFDRAQRIAFELTDADRMAGRPAPAVGYSAANFEKAKKLL